MSTVSDLIKGSMRLIGAIAAGETPTASELADGLSALNEMIESWSTEKLIIPAMTRETFSLVGGTQSYTIGSGGDFDTVRPIKIEKALLQYQSSPLQERPIEILNLDQWTGIVNKDTDSDYPTALYYDPTFLLGTLKFWPKPSAAKTIVLHSWKELTQLATSSTDVEFPPGYYRALRYNLAVEIAPEYGQEASPTIASIANEAKANIKRANRKVELLSVDQALVQNKGFDYKNGE